MATPDLSPDNKPFDRFFDDLIERDSVSHAAMVALDCIAAAKRILLQERVRDFTAADVVALAAIIESRDRLLVPKL